MGGLANPAPIGQARDPVRRLDVVRLHIVAISTAGDSLVALLVVVECTAIQYSHEVFVCLWGVPLWALLQFVRELSPR